LECGGLTPLSFFFSVGCSAVSPKKEKKESGVKPPHSKSQSAYCERHTLQKEFVTGKPQTSPFDGKMLSLWMFPNKPDNRDVGKDQPVRRG
jgi:hypothetical protein